MVGSHLKTGGQAPSLGSEVSRASSGLATLIEMNLPRMAELPMSCPGYRCSRVVLKSFIHSCIHLFPAYSVLGNVRGPEDIKMNTTQSPS